MERHYKHLNAEERGVILAEHRRGSSLRQIGRLLGRHHATTGLELTRGAAPGGYDPQVARLARYAAQRHSGRRRKLVPEAPFYAWVRDRLIESFFRKLKEFKRTAMGSDKADTSFTEMIYATAAVINSR
jgi:IS30 family transposase